jgi:hypothetical protein
VSHCMSIYRAAAGQYRQRRVENDGKWPNFLINNADQQAHIINGKAVFPRAPLIHLDEWSDLQTQARPAPPRYIEGRMVICEDNSFWPVDIRPFSSNAQKAADCDVFYQETLQASKAKNASEVGANPRDKRIFAVASIVAVVGGLAIIGDLLITKAAAFISEMGPQVPVVAQTLGGG